MPWGLSRRAGRPVFFCLANSALAFPGHSPAFPQRSFWGPAQQERPSPFLVRASGLREFLSG